MILCTWGWLRWNDARDVVGQASGTWLGSSSVELGPLPAHCPITDRIHAWADSPSLLWRLRLDGRGSALVTALASEPGSGTCVVCQR